MTLISCEDDIVVEDSYENVFETFWKIMDEHYVYFNEKQLDWDSIYCVYSPRIDAITNDDELAQLLSGILNSWVDHHVVIYPPDRDVIHNSNQLPFKFTFSYSLNGLYSFGDYEYKLPQFSTIENRDGDKQYAYLSIKTLAESIAPGVLEEALSHLYFGDGLIVDLRLCGGGFFSNVYRIATNFYDGERDLFYKQAKNGPGRNDFGSLEPIIRKGTGLIPDSVPVIVLIDSANFSASNVLAFILNDLPNTITLGTTTGGGGSPINNVYLPNGWLFTYSYLKLITVSGKDMELGLVPDIVHNFVLPKYFKGDRDEHIAIALELLDSINGFEKINYQDMYKDED